METTARVLTDNLDIWTSAIEPRSSAGRGRSKKFSLYGIEKLRSLIFDLAALGKLVKGVDIQPTTLGQYVQLVMGQAPPGDKCNKSGEGTIFVKTGEFGDLYPDIVEWTTMPLKFARRGDVLICVVGATIGKLNLAIDCAIGRSVAAIRPDQTLDTKFLYYSLMPYTIRLRGGARGSAQGVIGRDDLKAINIRVPPLAEQHRIVASVDELMALCDRIEGKTYDAIEAHELLVEELLATLTNSRDANAFADDWARVEAHFDTLFTTETSIDQLKRTILQLAVMGKLVAQDPSDERADELLKRISKEIVTYSKAQRIRPAQPDPINAHALRFLAPAGWQWTRLCSLFKVITDGDHQPPPRADEGVAFLTIGNITTGKLDFEGCRLVPEDYFRSLAPYRTPADGDILYTVVGATYGRPAIVETERDFCVQRHIAILKPVENMDLRFIAWLLMSPLVYEQASQSTTGTAQPTIALRPLRNFLVPLPPLAEQKRIAAKIDQLIGLCDELKALLTQAQQERVQFSDAVTSRALG
jgi:type I restriction enzyme S subunit